MPEQMNNLVVVKAVADQVHRKKKKKNQTDRTNGGGRKEKQKPEDRSAETKQEVTHKGSYILDATVADQ